MTRWGRFKHIQLTDAVMMPVAILLIAMTDPTATLLMVVFLSLVGCGIGLQLPTSTVAVQNAVPQHHVGVATGVAAFCRSLGAAIGIALLMALLLTWLRSGAGVMGDGLTGANIIGTLGIFVVDPSEHNDFTGSVVTEKQTVLLKKPCPKPMPV